MKKDGMHIAADGTKWWYKNGLSHRENGPAYEDALGTKQWFKDGQYHREDGPAVIFQNDDNFWFLNGNWHPSFDEWLKELDVSDEDKLILTLKWI